MDALHFLRKTAKNTRRALSKYQQQHATQDVLKHIIKHPKFKAAQHIGVYLSAFGEIETHALIQLCFRHHKQVYLPQITSMNQTLTWVNISFQQYKNQRFYTHRLGMKEPKNHRGHHVKTLDVLFLPLVLADQYGTRIGMGGGYYDRTLSLAPKRPYRIGLAHDFQVSNTRLQRNPWDQSLDGLITPHKHYLFSR